MFAVFVYKKDEVLEDYTIIGEDRYTAWLPESLKSNLYNRVQNTSCEFKKGIRLMCWKVQTAVAR